MKNSNRKNALLLAVIVPAALVLCWSCSTLGNAVRAPKVSVSSVNITRVNFQRIQFLAKVKIDNPNYFDIPFPQFEWELLVNANSFVEGAIENREPVGARKSTIVEVPFSLAYPEVFDTISTLWNKDEAEYTIKVGAIFEAPLLGTRRLDIEHTGSFPLLQLPQVSVKGIKLITPSTGSSRSDAWYVILPTKLDFEIEFEVENRNSFAMAIQNFNYDLRVNDIFWGRGTVAKSPRISAHGKAVIPLAVSISTTDAINALDQIIRQGAALNYTFGGGLELAGDFPGLSSLDLPINLRGSTQLQQ